MGIEIFKERRTIKVAFFRVDCGDADSIKMMKKKKMVIN